MRIRIVNPNTTTSMTEKIAATARAVAAPDTEIEAVNPADGPVSIEGQYDEAHALPGLLALIREGEARGADGFIIACADDPGLFAAREVASGPVVGITEAAIKMATVIGNGFSIVTTVKRDIPAFRTLAQRYGTERFLRSVRAAGIAVLDLENPASGARDRVLAEVSRAVEDDGAETIILGCAGMTDLAAWLTSEIGVPVIDGVAAAVKLIEALCDLGLGTCKLGSFGLPLAKPFSGAMAPHAYREE